MPLRRIATEHRFSSHLQKVMAQSRLYRAMEYQSLQVAKVEDDFFGPTLNTFLWNVSNGGGGSAANPVISGTLVVNGAIEMVTGTAGNDTASSDLSGGLSYRGDHGAVFVAHIATSSISAGKMELGFTDATADAGAVLIKADRTFTATDCALWVYDSIDNANWEGLAANNGTTAPMATVEAGISPVANTFEWLMVELIESDDANTECAVEFSRFTSEGVRTFREIGGGIEETNAGPNANVLLTPWIYVEASDGVSKTLTVDYVGVYQARTVTVT